MGGSYTTGYCLYTGLRTKMALIVCEYLFG